MKLRILKIIPKLKYLLTDADISEEIHSMLIKFTDDDSQEVCIRAEEIKLMLFRWKKAKETEEGKEEEKFFEEERIKREKVIKSIIKI